MQHIETTELVSGADQRVLEIESIRPMIECHPEKNLKKPTFMLLVLGSMASLLLYSLFIEPHWMRLKHIEVALPLHFHNLSGVKIMQISDLHLHGSLGRNEKRTLKWAKEIKPDIIALTGDLIEEPYLVDEIFKFIEDLPEDAQIYVVLGNWEHWANIELKSFAQELQNRGANLLVNECSSTSVRGEPLVVAALDDISTGFADMTETLKNCPTGYRILLSHTPVAFDDKDISEFQVILAGHCHGGQVRIPILGPVWLPEGCGRYAYGLFKRNGSTMYVTSGVGTSILPIRFLSRPEVAVIHLKKPEPTEEEDRQN